MTVPDLARLALADRIATIATYDLSNVELRRSLDALCRRTARGVGVSAAMVSVVLDTAQLFVGSCGVDGWMTAAEGTPAEWAFCTHAVLSGKPVYVVPDAAADPRHADSPLVTGEGTRAYAGAALLDPDSHALGMHCVVATEPREFSAADLAMLRAGADEAMAALSRYRRPAACPS